MTMYLYTICRIILSFKGRMILYKNKLSGKHRLLRMAMATSMRDNPYETSAAMNDRSSSNPLVSLLVVGFVLVLIFVVFYPVLNMATNVSGDHPSFVLAPLMQHICSRLLTLLVMLLAIAGGLGFLAESRTTNVESRLIKRAMAGGLLVNGILISIWVLSDAIHGFSTDHSTASEYARGFLCSTFIISPVGGIIIFGPILGIVRVIKRHPENAK